MLGSMQVRFEAFMVNKFTKMTLMVDTEKIPEALSSSSMLTP
jgi:hypothetical protein